MISEVSIEQRDSWQRQPKYPNTQSNLLIKKLKKKKKKPFNLASTQEKKYISSPNQAKHTRLILIILSSSKNWQLLWKPSKA